MSKVIFDVSMSMDGYVMATDPTPDEPLGRGGHRLHDWALDDDPDGKEFLAAAVAESGAFVGGRKTYDDSLRWWGANGPTGPARVPLVILTHREPEDVPEDGVYTFVTDGVESALRKARELAGDKNIYVMGGPNVASQFIRAGLVDEIGIHLVPVLFGGGTRLVDHIGSDHIELEVVSVVDTPAATHLLYRIVK